MTTISQLIANIRQQISKTPQQMADELSHASGFELGFRHSNGAFALLRDDKVVELNAGNGSVVTVDGPGQTVGVTAGEINLESKIIQFKVPPGNVFFGYQPINAYWFVTDPLDVTGPFFRSPLLCKAPVPPSSFAVPGLGLNPLDTIYVSPSPTLPVATPAGPGTLTGLVPLSTYVHAEPLFGMNQQLLTLSRNLGEVIKNLSSMGV